jgi:transcriptional activator SPT7
MSPSLLLPFFGSSVYRVKSRSEADQQEMILHALYENGGLAPSDIESHIKDDIEKEGIKLVDMDKKMGQAYKDIVSHYRSSSPVIAESTFCLTLLVPCFTDRTDIQATAPVIEDDMMFADNGEMLLE